MDADAWDARYATTDRMWSVEPNMWLEEVVAGLPPSGSPGAPGAPATESGSSAVPGERASAGSAGRALDLACGEGRNALWLAEQGWTVTAVDFSAVALERGRSAAGGDAVSWVEADVLTWTPPAGAFDLVALVYLHLEDDERRAVLARSVASLAPGGTLVVIGHDRRNLTEGVGGPPIAHILLDPTVVAAELAAAMPSPGLDVVRADTVPRPTPEGTALYTLVVARRPP